MSEFNRILKHSVIYGVGNILSKMIGFILIPVYTNILTTEEYGLMELLQNTMNVIQIIVGMGLGTAILRFYSENKQREAQETVISTSILFSTFFGAAVAGICILFSTNLSLLILQNKGYAEPFTVMMFVLFFTNMIEIPLVVIRAKEKSHIYVFVCLAQLLLGLILNIVFIVIL
ncbi:MAG: oligosaccharide flippase family protein, partial [Planctomycetes bacterium]|nr:oligosaccharide flippase family protein [Planctomycetota bacterium]